MGIRDLMKQEKLMVTFNKKTFFKIKIKAIRPEVSESQLESFVGQLSDAIVKILDREYTDGMELIH